MSISKLSSQIRREMTSDPKKAVILAGLLLLAGYYWAPLVWGWASKGGADDQEAQLAALAASSDAGQFPTVKAEVPSAADGVHAPLHRWQPLRRWLDTDPRTKPLMRVSGRRDPFTDRSATRRTVERSATVLHGPVTPESLGMRLTGVMIGARRRVALIDGEAYVVGERISVELTAATKTQAAPAADERPRYVEFLLAEVFLRRVVLRREKKSYELKLPNPEPRAAFVISYPNREASASGP